MKLTTLLLEQRMIQALDELVEKRIYPNRAEAIRVAVRELLIYHGKWGLKNG